MANRYFIGAVDADWHDTGNWSASSGGAGGASIPTVGDDAIFDNNSPSCTVDADIDCDSIVSLSGALFAGTLNLNGFDWTGAGQLTWQGGTIQLGSGTVSLSGNISIGGGTVNMQSAAVTTQGAVTGTAGTVTLTSGTLQLWGNLDLNVGTLAHNNGRVEWIGAGVVTFNPRAKTYYNLKLTSSSVTVQGTLSCNGLELGAAAGTWDCNGFGHTLADGLTVAGGTFDANGAASVTVTGTVTQTAGTIDLDTATVSMPGTISVTGGTFTATSGTLTFGQSANAVVLTPGTFNHNGGTVRHIPTFSSTKNITWTGAAFNNFEMHNSGQSTVNVTGTATAVNFTFANTGGSPSSRVLGGRVQISGNLAATANGLHGFGGSFVVEFTGAGAQSWTDAGTPGPTRKWTAIQVNKSGGMVTLGAAAWIDTSLTVSTNHLATSGYKLVLCADSGSGDTFAWTAGGITYDTVETRMWAQARVNVTGTALVGGDFIIQPALSGSGDRQVNGGQVDVYGAYEVGWAGDNANDAGSTLVRMVGSNNASLKGQIAFALRTRYGNPLTIQKTGGAVVTQYGHFGLRSSDLNINSNLDGNGYDIGARDVTLGAGGTYNARWGNLRCYRTLDLVTGGGTWIPGTGTVESWGSGTGSAQQVTGSPALNNFTVGNDSGTSVSYTLTLTGNPVVNGTLDLRGYNSGGWQRYVNGNTLYVRGGMLNTGSQPVFGTTLLTIDGGSDQTCVYNGGLSLTTATKASGMVRWSGVFVINASLSNVTHTYSAVCDWITNTSYWTVSTLGGNRTVQLVGSGISSITVPGTSINHAAATNPAVLDLGGLTVYSGDTQYTASYSTHSRRVDNGIIDVSGALVVNIVDNGAQTGSALFRMTGGVDKTLTFTAASQDRYWNDLEIAKSGGAKVTLASQLGTKGAGQNIAVTSGVLDLAGYSVTAGGTFSVAAGATLRAKGSETITAGAKSWNAASNTVLYDNTVTALLDGLSTSFGNLDLGPGGKTVNTTAGATVNIAGTLAATGAGLGNTVLIRSTVPGTQCFWTLNAVTGVSQLGQGVNVRDNNASGGRTIIALGSVDSGNNVNWFFGAGGGRNPRASMIHAYPEGFVGGVNPRDFLSYVVGMPGMGGAGGGGSVSPPAPGASMVVGLNSLALPVLSRYTVDAGVTWANSAWNPVPVFPDYLACLLDLGSGTLLAFVSRSGSTKVYRSTDTGASFTQVGAIGRQVRGTWPPIILPTGRIIVGVQDETLGTDYLCAYSDDNGATWTVVTIAAGQDATTYGYNTAHLARQADGKLCTLVISAIGSARIYYSADNGLTWTMGNAPFSTTTMSVFRHPDGKLGSIRTPGGGGGIYWIYRHTEVAPGSWDAVLAGSFAWPSANIPTSAWLDEGDGLNGRLLVCTGNPDSIEVLLTTDGGVTWASVQVIGGAAGSAAGLAFNGAHKLGATRTLPFDNQPASTLNPIVWKDTGAGFAKIGNVIVTSPPTPVPVGIVVS